MTNQRANRFRSHGERRATFQKFKHVEQMHGCEYQGKMRYETKNQARTAGAEFATYHGYTLRPYHCPACKMWHLTKRAEP